MKKAIVILMLLGALSKSPKEKEIVSLNSNTIIKREVK